MKKSLYSLWSILLAVFLVLSLTGCPPFFDPENPPDAEEVDVFGSKVTVLPSDTTGSAGTSGTYVEFGYWPQTIKDSSVTVDESISVTYGDAVCYQGDDGYFYVKCLENAYVTGEQYTYSDGTSVALSSSNSYAYFKVEPIKWRVLDANYKGSGNKLLLAEDILTSNIPFFEGNANHQNGSAPNNYQDSQIRAFLNGNRYAATTSSDEDRWLNAGFLQSAFTQKAQNRIVTTAIDNSADSTTNTAGNITKAASYACAQTNDKVFLLSEYEVTKYSEESYASYGCGNSRLRKPTDYALANNCYQSSTEGFGGYWWLRSPDYMYNNYALSVGYGGGAKDSYTKVSNTYYGVVPAIVVSY